MTDRVKQDDEIGALWLKQGKKGEFLSGTIEGVGDVIAFPVTGGGLDTKVPAWRVLKSEPRSPRSARLPKGPDRPLSGVDDPFA